jgi:AcrR family transcriptional regulator
MASDEGETRAGGGKPGRPRCPGTDKAILDATQRQLAAVGYTRMSIDAIAAEAGTTKPTVYRRWPTKEALAVAALARLQRADSPGRVGDTRADLLAMLGDFQTKLLRPNGMAMIGNVLAEEAHVPELIRRFREQIVHPRRAALRAILQDALGRGELAHGADLEAAVNLLIGSFYALYLTGTDIPTDWPERVTETVLLGLATRR